MAEAVLVASDVPQWGDGWNLFSTTDGKHFVVVADLVSQSGRTVVIQRPTTVMECDDTASPESASTAAVYDPGTTHEDAMMLLGYTIGSE